MLADYLMLLKKGYPRRLIREKFDVKWQLISIVMRSLVKSPKADRTNATSDTVILAKACVPELTGQHGTPSRGSHLQHRGHKRGACLR